MLIQANLTADINDAETQAAQGCGQSDVLYEKRVQKAYRDILDGAPEGDRAAVEIALKERVSILSLKPTNTKRLKVNVV